MRDPEFDNTQAMTEGWSIFECFGSDHGKWQLQKMDDEDVFASDSEAWAFVVDKADTGSLYHRQALKFLSDHNKQELQLIINAVYVNCVGLT